MTPAGDLDNSAVWAGVDVVLASARSRKSNETIMVLIMFRFLEWVDLLRRFPEDRLIDRHIVRDLLKRKDEGLIGHLLSRLKRDLHTVYRVPVAEVNFGVHRTMRSLTCHVPANEQAALNVEVKHFRIT